MGKPRRTVIAADHQQRVIQLPGLLQFIQQHLQSGIEGGNLTEVVSQVLTHFRHVRQVGRHFAFQVVRLNPPQRLARALGPLAMDVGGTEPVAEWLAWLARRQELGEVPAHLVQQLLLGLIDRLRPGRSGPWHFVRTD